MEYASKGVANTALGLSIGALGSEALTGGKRIGMGTYATLAMDGSTAKIQKCLKHPAVDILDIQDENGQIDLDRIRSAVLPMMETEKLELTIPLIGTFRLDKNDIDQLCRYIQEA